MMFIHTGAFILLQGTNVLSEQLVELMDQVNLQAPFLVDEKSNSLC